MSISPKPCSYEDFRTWLLEVRDFVYREAGSIYAEIQPLTDRQSVLKRELQAISQQTLEHRREVARRTKKLQTMGLGWLCNFSPVRAWIERAGSSGCAKLLETRANRLAEISRIEAQIADIRGNKSKDHPGYLEAERFWRNLTDFERYARKEYAAISSLPLVSCLFLYGDSLHVVTTNLTCSANIGDDVEIVRLGVMRIAISPGSPIGVRNLTKRPQAVDAEGVLRTWEAPHIRSDVACFKERRDDLLALKGEIKRCISNQITALQVANFDAWGVPVMRLFPRDVEAERVARLD